MGVNGQESLYRINSVHFMVSCLCVSSIRLDREALSATITDPEA